MRLPRRPAQRRLDSLGMMALDRNLHLHLVLPCCMAVHKKVCIYLYHKKDIMSKQGGKDCIFF